MNTERLLSRSPCGSTVGIYLFVYSDLVTKQQLNNNNILRAPRHIIHVDITALLPARQWGTSLQPGHYLRWGTFSVGKLLYHQEFRCREILKWKPCCLFYRKLLNKRTQFFRKRNATFLAADYFCKIYTSRFQHAWRKFQANPIAWLSCQRHTRKIESPVTPLEELLKRGDIPCQPFKLLHCTTSTTTKAAKIRHSDLLGSSIPEFFQQ